MKTKIEVVRNMGLSWTMFRAKYEMEKKLGLLKKQYPVFSYSKVDLQSKIISDKSLKELVKRKLKKFFFQPDVEKLTASKEVLNLNNAIIEADDILQHKFNYFSKHVIDFEAIDWHYSPFTKKNSPDKQHWTEIGDLSSDFGDIKWIWELSRFTFVYPLCRAYVITGDEKYASAFWSMFEDFIQHNPPELGVNYKCGQEMSFRIMAWTFGLNTFFNSTETTDERLELMMKAIYHHADHVEKHFDFALKSVKNNHSLSEAAGMYTAGIVFPFFDLSSKWVNKGKKYIQSEANWQIYDDGSYIQHSFNYQRLAIQDLTWVVRLGQINGDKFEGEFMGKFEKTVEFLYQMQNPVDGRLPNYGMNDGAYIHPFTSREYLDYRPALQAAWLTLTGSRLYEVPKVDEIAIWLGLETDRQCSLPDRESNLFKDGGYATLRNDDQFAMIRCATFKHRPVQADMLHVDFWHGEHNILADAGTFSYNTSPEYLLYFNGTASHNTLMLNDRDQMTKASRFIWLNWTKSKVLSFTKVENATIFEGEHYGYSPVTHRRGVYQLQDVLIIVDDLLGDIQTEKVSLRWLFGIHDVKETSNGKWEITLPDESKWKMKVIQPNMNGTSSLHCGSTAPVAGWRSLYYGDKEAFPQLIIDDEITESSRYISVLYKDKPSIEVSLNENTLVIGNEKVNLSTLGSSKIFENMEI
ncbi:alginate lyase family protein [Sporosarcina sp. Marseille-Q4063]|uniref:alginate lyase family protein n=1 Tax=Sporosarcina sp. Marseille-Q4063 TaxID=2810514 RepID=UPI001BAFB170|nr:alginate lyase family protein [Sporosarcina sp. Marseille-Q4063]QUW21251.1 alginate lyase family protein [Sporosarcina sp. Marseille-Q4063]